ncbi:MAG: MFS transporter [Mollicutes bacterium]|nr:MFS transporter [Mollicutes bacterium]
MTKQTSGAPETGFKLNVKRTMLIGFAFFGILLMWQVYDGWCPAFLSDMFCRAFGYDITDPAQSKQVQYLVGIVMAMDNLAALILMPIFGHLSDKTHTKIGKRMPFILTGTFVCAIAMPFIPLLFHLNNIIGVISMMAIVLLFGMMYRNPAVALMPDITPKPLRSRANGLINVMGYFGGAVATVLGMFLVVSKYIKDPSNPQYHNLWVIETPFLLASVLMVASALVLFFTIKENKLEEELRDEMARGEEMAAIEEKIVDDDQPLSKANRRMLFLILGAEFFWFMAENGVSTFLANYAMSYLGTDTAKTSMCTLIGGICSVVGFVLGGLIASKIGRKWTLWGGLALTLASYAVWTILTFTFAPNGTMPIYVYVVFAAKGFGMSLVHINSFPMVVELCSKKKIGAFTGYYYASSMAAQTVTPIVLGSLLLIPNFSWRIVPAYAMVCLLIATIIFVFVKNVKTEKTKIAKGLEALGQED